MKKLLILLLFAALAAGAHLSRPDQADFERFIQEGSERQFEGAGGRVIIRFEPAAGIDHYTFRDRWVFSAVEQNDETVYVGAFGQWFRWGDPPAGEGDRTAPVTAPPEPAQPASPLPHDSLDA